MRKRKTLSPSAMLPSEFEREREIRLSCVLEYTITLPEPPSYKKIAGWNQNINNQRWKIPSDILSQKEFEALDFDDQVIYLKKITKRRTEGYWFYNHGNIEYLTGDHYFYLAHWRIDGIVPYWKDSDSTFFYIENHCKFLENSLGWILVTNRRDGKTGRACSLMYNNITLQYDANGGIQSKTGADAKKIFRKLMLSWQKLPAYLKPVDVGESAPKASLVFAEPAKRSTKGAKKEYRTVLNSMIDHGPATDTHYDGDKMKYYYDDEFGKTVEENVYERWLIVKECLVQGSTVIGKSIHTTTAEEMEEKGGANAKKLWDESNLPLAISKGRNTTPTGLLRWFKPALFGLEGFVDEYGYSVVEDPEKPVMGIHGKVIEFGSRSYINKRRLGLTGSALAGEKRKYPLTIDEAFIEEGKLSPFDVIKLNDQVSYNSETNGIVVTGNFVWLDQEKTEAVWQPTESGRWKQCWLPHPKDRNKKILSGRQRKPGNYTTIVSGCDPFDHKITTDGKKSNGASYIFRKLDPLDSDRSNMFVCEYVNRPATPEMFYEDMAKQSVYYGCQLLCENNKIGLIRWFENNGFDSYLMERPMETHTEYSRKRQSEKGIPMSGEAVREAAVSVTESYIYENVGRDYNTNVMGKVYFQDLCRCWLKFNPQKWTDYDEFVGAALCLFAARSYRPQKKPRGKKKFIKTYRKRRK
tara:strand:- start:22346 stop:24427 length:2082 start_codon:yes stop_codon:yes gene_type:complete